MFKTILFYGLVVAALIIVLNLIQYSFLIRTHVFEIYGGLIAILFMGLGLWFGNNLKSKKTEVNSELQIETNPEDSGISKREFEVLQLISQGLSNQEIADKLFVSTNTIKTHTSRLFEKLEVKNRTQALLKAKERKIL